jgi:hypothetical protein
VQHARYLTLSNILPYEHDVELPENGLASLMALNHCLCARASDVHRDHTHMLGGSLADHYPATFLVIVNEPFYP